MGADRYEQGRADERADFVEWLRRTGMEHHAEAAQIDFGGDLDHAMVFVEACETLAALAESSVHVGEVERLFVEACETLAALAESSVHVGEVERLRREERDEARDCGQDVVCATPPGCQRHWAERNLELVTERDEAREAMVRLASAAVQLESAQEEDPTRAEYNADDHRVRLHFAMDAHATALDAGEALVAKWKGGAA